MTVFNSYTTGTVTVTAGGTTVTGTGTTWSGINAKSGDDLIINGFTAVVMDVVDATHLTIKPWPYAAQTTQPYAIVWRSPLRYVGGQAMHDVDSLIAYLTGGVFPTISGGSAANSTLVLQSTSVASGSTTDMIQFKTGSPPVERMRITSPGPIVIGGATIAAQVAAASEAILLALGGGVANGPTTGTSYLTVASYDTGSHGTNSNIYVSLNNANNDGYGELFYITYARGTIGAQIKVNNNDYIGGIRWSATFDGANHQYATAEIGSGIDGVTTSGQHAPGRWYVSTTANNGTITERMRVNSVGQISTNGQFNTTLFNVGPNTGCIQLNALGGSIMSIHGYGPAGNVGSANVYMMSSRGASIGAQAAMQIQDALGVIYFGGSDGSSMAGCGAQIRVEAAANFTGASLPTQIIIGTSPSGASFPTERLRIQSNGCIVIGNGTQSLTNLYGDNATLQLNAGPEAGGASLLDIRRGGTNAFAGYISFEKHRGTTTSTTAPVNAGDQLGAITFGGYDSGNVVRESGGLIMFADTPTANSVPTNMRFYTGASGVLGSTERMRINAPGDVFLLNAGGASTTGSAANAFINTGSSPVGQVLRSTSSMRYKDQVTPVPRSRLDAIMALDPIEYCSLALADDRQRRFVGLGAEQVAEIDPGLVNFDADGQPDGVMYDRVLLLQVAALKARIEQLEGKT